MLQHLLFLLYYVNVFNGFTLFMLRAITRQVYLGDTIFRPIKYMDVYGVLTIEEEETGLFTYFTTDNFNTACFLPNWPVFGHGVLWAPYVTNMPRLMPDDNDKHVVHYSSNI